VFCVTRLLSLFEQPFKEFDSIPITAITILIEMFAVMPFYYLIAFAACKHSGEIGKVMQVRSA